MIITFFGILVAILPIFEPAKDAAATLFQAKETEEPKEGMVICQENSLLPLSRQNEDIIITQEFSAIVTAYSSTPWQTKESDPFTTASGTSVRDGIVANNKLPFGTKVRFPEIYGDKIFVVEDRMHWRKWDYHFDIWFADTSEAINFGAKRTYVEILGS